MKYRTWNDVNGLENLARAEFDSLDEAKDFRTEAGGPNRIISDDGEEWVRCGHADSAPYWVGPYSAGYLAGPAKLRPWSCTPYVVDCNFVNRITKAQG